MDRCAIQGSPTSIVLLHGLGDGADIWRPTLTAWPYSQLTLPVMALDLPCHGSSGRLAAGGYRVEGLAGIVAAALARQRITRLVLIGHSLGARVALTLAARRLVAAPRTTVLID